VDPAVAETVAAEAGATTAVLDPVEGITDRSAGDDYPSVMRAILQTLREGQGCS
jgi:zinc transport system substrate-binding protein